MRPRRVTPSTIIARQSVIRRAEIRRRDEYRRAARMTPFRVVGTFDFETRATTLPVVEQGSAQRGRVNSVPLAVQVSVPTSSPHGSGGVGAAVEGGVGGLPWAAGVDTRDASVDEREKGGEREEYGEEHGGHWWWKLGE